jgi:hypothetical protein
MKSIEDSRNLYENLEEAFGALANPPPFPQAKYEDLAIQKLINKNWRC